MKNRLTTILFFLFVFLYQNILFCAPYCWELQCLEIQFHNGIKKQVYAYAGDIFPGELCGWKNPLGLNTGVNINHIRYFSNVEQVYQPKLGKWFSKFYIGYNKAEDIFFLGDVEKAIPVYGKFNKVLRDFFQEVTESEAKLLNKTPVAVLEDKTSKSGSVYLLSFNPKFHESELRKIIKNQNPDAYIHDFIHPETLNNFKMQLLKKNIVLLIFHFYANL